MALVRGVPMVERVWRQCQKTDLPTFIAADDAELVGHMQSLGACTFFTGDCRSGSDRCAAVVQSLRIKVDIVVNVQCDMPFVPPEFILEAADAVKTAAWATLVSIQSGVVAVPMVGGGITFARIDYNWHVGIYAFRRRTLEDFAQLETSENERRMSLEQMRLVDNGIPGAIRQVPFAPLEVNTPEDLDRINAQ